MSNQDKYEPYLADKDEASIKTHIDAYINNYMNKDNNEFSIDITSSSYMCISVILFFVDNVSKHIENAATALYLNKTPRSSITRSNFESPIIGEKMKLTDSRRINMIKIGVIYTVSKKIKDEQRSIGIASLLSINDNDLMRIVNGLSSYSKLSENRNNIYTLSKKVKCNNYCC